MKLSFEKLIHFKENIFISSTKYNIIDNVTVLN